MDSIRLAKCPSAVARGGHVALCGFGQSRRAVAVIRLTARDHRSRQPTSSPRNCFGRQHRRALMQPKTSRASRKLRCFRQNAFDQIASRRRADGPAISYDPYRWDRSLVLPPSRVVKIGWTRTTLLIPPSRRRLQVARTRAGKCRMSWRTAPLSRQSQTKDRTSRALATWCALRQAPDAHCRETWPTV